MVIMGRLEIGYMERSAPVHLAILREISVQHDEITVHLLTLWSEFPIMLTKHTVSMNQILRIDRRSFLTRICPFGREQLFSFSESLCFYISLYFIVIGRDFVWILSVFRLMSELFYGSCTRNRMNKMYVKKKLKELRPMDDFLFFWIPTIYNMEADKRGDKNFVEIGLPQSHWL